MGFYRNKTEFRDAIRNFFDNIHTYKKELESLSNSQFPFDKFTNHFFLTINHNDYQAVQCKKIK